MHRSFRLSFLSMVAALACAGSAQAAVIYSTDFEADAPGSLIGQDGWLEFGGGGAVVQSVFAKSGQAVQVPGGTAGQNGPHHSSPSGARFIDVNADIMLGSATTEGAWQFATLGSGLSPFLAGIDIDADGTIHAITSGFGTLGSLSRNQWYNLDIKMDFLTKTYSVSLDGSLLGSNLAFCGDNGTCAGGTTASFDTVFFDTFGGAGGHNDSGYLDNLLVQTFAVPEPATWALLLIGIGGIGGVLRSDRRKLRAATA